jgi:hypothetical protein
VLSALHPSNSIYETRCARPEPLDLLSSRGAVSGCRDAVMVQLPGHLADLGVERVVLEATGGCAPSCSAREVDSKQRCPVDAPRP